MTIRAFTHLKHVIKNVFRPTVANRRELRRYVLSVTFFAVSAALCADVINNMVFFESWGSCLRSWSITAALSAGIAVPIARSIGKAHMELHFAKREADRIGRTDPLTGLANRRAFYEATERFHGGVVALVIADIDRFKRINDRHGHAAGDEVLRVVSNVMRSELGELGTLARVGGEEFALVCNRSPSEIRDRLQRVRHLLGATPFIFSNGSVLVTISAGIAARSCANFDELYAAADKALYLAKANGRDLVVDADTIEAVPSERDRFKPPLPLAS